MIQTILHAIRPSIGAVFSLVLATQVLGDDGAVICPSADEIVYSPFKAWFNFYNGANEYCWQFAICLFDQADSARVQQFSATALVMGFIPLTLKDIAWPERRSVHVSKRLPWVVEVVVRALGLEPLVTPLDKSTRMIDRAETERRAVEGSAVVEWAWNQEKRVVWMMAGLSAFGLILSFGIIAIVEIFSKRSALGCPYPFFVVTWYLAAIVPAVIHVLFARRASAIGRRSSSMYTDDTAETVRLNQETGEPKSIPSFGNKRRDEEAKDEESAIQGAGEWWVVQFAWAVYYIAGTLIFTSIMAVTVVELVVWLMCSMAVTGCSKIFGFFLCMTFEMTGNRRYIR